MRSVVGISSAVHIHSMEKEAEMAKLLTMLNTSTESRLTLHLT